MLIALIFVSVIFKADVVERNTECDASRLANLGKNGVSASYRKLN